MFVVNSKVVLDRCTYVIWVTFNDYHSVIFEGTVQQKIVPEKWHEILIGTIRQVRNAKKLKIPTIEIWENLA